MLFDHREIIYPPHQHINLPSVSSASVDLTFQEVDLLQTPKYPDKHQNQDGLSADVWDMHDLESPGCVGKKSLLHPLACVLPRHTYRCSLSHLTQILLIEL